VAVVIVSSLPVVLRHTEAVAQEGATAPTADKEGSGPAAIIAKIHPKSNGVSGSAPTAVKPVNRESADQIEANSSKTETARVSDAEGLKTRDKRSAVTLTAK
jgi:hypothetical protein